MNKSIPLKTETKFLGIIIDESLNWESHINDLSKKVASDCYLIKRLMKVTTLETAKLVYFSNIESRLSYGVILWGSASKCKRLFTLQKRALRFMAKASVDPCAVTWIKDSCRPLFRRFKILTLTCLYIFNVILYMRNENSSCTAWTNAYETRQKNQLKLQKPNLLIYKTGPTYGGCIFYNVLPLELRDKNGYDFKRGLKNYLIEHCFYTIDEFLNVHKYVQM
jgi:hypothetical protein